MKSKPGKYIGAVFTPEQTQARKMWQHKRALIVALADGMKISQDSHTRKEWHEWLDRRLDNIESIERKAIQLFPEVDQSFTIVTYTIG